MSRAARSVLVFGVYVGVVGLLLSTVPNLVMGPLGFPEAREPWIRVLGVVVVVVAFYYLQAARHELTPFIQWTVWARAVVLVGFVLLVVAGQAAPALILFGLIDAAGAAWTAFELRTSRRTR
jgi:O-antigen/teichoic acid export membrane protein